jgi:hypothetical protein
MLPSASFLAELEVIANDTLANKYQVTLSAKSCEQFDHLIGLAYVPVSGDDLVFL